MIRQFKEECAEAVRELEERGISGPTRHVRLAIPTGVSAAPHIRELCGKPLIAWSIEDAQKSKYIDDIFISTQTACSVGDYSRAVYVITNDKDRASSSVRISLSYKTTKEEIREFLDVLKEYLNESN